jgi:hypothetical protein
MEFHTLTNLIDDIKHKLTDYEYKSIMDSIMDIHQLTPQDERFIPSIARSPNRVEYLDRDRDWADRNLNFVAKYRIKQCPGLTFSFVGPFDVNGLVDRVVYFIPDDGSHRRTIFIGARVPLSDKINVI